ncbi:MAG: dockerin type I repeat-containing protein [Candidatus Zixiibacteriota bacterium]
MMQNLKLTFYVITGLLAVFNTVGADNIFPPDYNITCDYTLSGTEFQTDDTLIIRRALINNETYSLSGLYFSDNIPPKFDVASYTLKHNGNDIIHFYSGASQDSVIGFYDTYYWVVDDPNLPAITNTIYPGDSIVMEMKVTFTQGGAFSLPMHTTVFYGNQTGYFATANSISISVGTGSLCGDSDNNGTINLLDVIYLIKYLYKGGPEPSPINNSDVNASGGVNILDVVYLLNYLYKNGPGPNCP